MSEYEDLPRPNAVTVALSDDLFEHPTKLAAHEDREISDLLRDSLEIYLRRKGTPWNHEKVMAVHAEIIEKYGSTLKYLAKN